MPDVVFKVFRGDRHGGEDVEYRVPAVEGMVVLDAMHYIQAHLAGDLAVRWNCKAAKCGSCSAEVNGFPKLMCKTRLDDYVGQEIYVHPMKTFPVIKDLVTDVSWNYHVNKQIAPFTPNPDEQSPWTMYQEDVERLYEPRKCIECFLCQDVCHVLRNHGEMSEYYGPRFMVRYQYLSMHPKDTLDRRGAVRHKGGIGLCNITKCCQEVCPEHIKITDNSIIPLKERVADEFFDPIRFVGRALSGKSQKAAREKESTGVEAGTFTTTEEHRRQLDRLAQRKDLRTADRAAVRTLRAKVRGGAELSYQERQSLWACVQRYEAERTESEG